MVPVIGGGMYTDVMRLAGAKNVFGDQSKNYPSIGKESFAVQKPEVYILIHYQGTDTDQLSSYFYQTFPDTPASQKKKVIVIESNHWNAGVFLPDAIESIAKALHPEAF